MRSLEELVKIPRVDVPDPGTPAQNSVAGLIELLRSIPRPKIAVEVGCYRGISTETLLHFADHVIAVDPWVWPEWSPVRDAERDFFARLGCEPRLSVLKMRSVDAARLIADYTVNLVYIDAAHDEESVYQDLVSWAEKGPKGSYMAGHDYTEAVNGGGVIKAMKRWGIPPNRVFPDTSWLVRV